MLKCVWIITHRNRTFYAVGVSISIEIIIQRKISAFFVVVHHLRQKSIISSQKKEANKWVKIHFFLLVDDGSIFLYTFYLCHVSMRVNSDAILNVAILLFNQILTFSWHHQCLPVWYWAKCFCMNFYFSEFLFSDGFWKKNLYVCHSFDKTEIKANFTSIHVNYDENGKTGKRENKNNRAPIDWKSRIIEAYLNLGIFCWWCDAISLHHN